MPTSGEVNPRNTTKDAIQTIVIGAGPAGLAVGACLKRARIPALILEQSNNVGAAWRQHYDRLHLHTDKAHSELPFVHFPKGTPRYPSRLEVIAYLEDYTRKMQLEPRFGQQVVAALRKDDRWVVQTQDSHYQADNLIIATGYNREPYLPTWPGLASFPGPLLHSSEYRNGEPFKNQKVLVVGFGNSGGEIALDLWEHGAEPSLAVRSPVNVIPRELFGIPILTISIMQRKLPPRLADALNAPLLGLAIGDLTPYGLHKSSHGPLSQIQRLERIPLIDVGTVELIKQGKISVHPGIDRLTGASITFTNGSQRKFDALILATGYRPHINAFLEEAAEVCDENGKPTCSGREAPIPGLYFCGFFISPTGMLREISIEARRVSATIASKVGRAQTLSPKF